MAKHSTCIDCGAEAADGKRTSQVGRKGYVLCESCHRDRQIREDNIDSIRRVLKLEGRSHEADDEAALAAYLYGEIDLRALADRIGAPFGTIPLPPLRRDE